MTAHAETASRAASKRRFSRGLSSSVDRHLNPFFVKDVRSWLRSRKFLILFFTALGICQVVTVMIIADGKEGRNLFSVLVAGLAMVLVGVVPYLMQDKFADELASGSTELALISRMTPGRMVRGKILSGLTANLLFFSAVGPSVLIAYMLGGIHPYAMVYILLAVIALSTLSMILAIVLVTIMGRKPVKVISLALFGAGFGAAGMMLALSEGSVASRIFAEDGFWIANGIIGGEALFGGLFLYSVAVSRLSFSSANRDLLPRATLSLWTLLHLVAGFATIWVREHLFHLTSDADDIAEIALVLATLVFTLGFFLIANTPDRLSRRLSKQLPKSGLVRAFLLPGPGRLYPFVMIHFAALTVYSILYHLFVHHGRDGVTFPGFVFVGYYLLCGCYLLYRLLNRFVLKRGPAPATLALSIIAAVWLGWGVLLAAIFEKDAGVLLLLSPASAFYYIVEEKNLGGLIAVIAVASPCWIAATWMWIRLGSQARQEEWKALTQMSVPRDSERPDRG